MSEKWHVQFRSEARDELRTVPKQMAMRILAKLTELETDPHGFGTTPLVSDPACRRLRVGDYRVIYTLDHGHLIILVILVDNRATAYDRL